MAPESGCPTMTAARSRSNTRRWPCQMPSSRTSLPSDSYIRGKAASRTAAVRKRTWPSSHVKIPRRSISCHPGHLGFPNPYGRPCALVSWSLGRVVKEYRARSITHPSSMISTAGDVKTQAETLEIGDIPSRYLGTSSPCRSLSSCSSRPRPFEARPRLSASDCPPEASVSSPHLLTAHFRSRNICSPAQVTESLIQIFMLGQVEPIACLSLPDAVKGEKKTIAVPQPLAPSENMDLYRRRVKHNPERCAEGLGRKSLGELSPNDARVA
jgi:hypothetical protein